ncbi:MAG: hypothetical protein ACI4RD_02150 [Kiritimatiellia bacterium]
MSLVHTLVASVRGVAGPMVALWCIAAGLSIAYLAVPAFAARLEPVRLFQQEHGWLAAGAGRIVFCGLIPGVFLAFVPALRPRRLLATLTAQVAWSALWGIVCDAGFRLQAAFVGADRTIGTVLVKTGIDQFVFTPLVIAPANAVFFFYLARDFSLARVRAEWPPRFWRDLVAPNLVANWCVWLPVQAAVFLFPVDLQIHVNGLACSLWMLLCLQLGRASK